MLARLLAVLMLMSALPLAGSVLNLTPIQRAPAPRAAALMFIENVGQFDARARFQARGGGGTLWLARDAVWIALLQQPRREGRPDFRSLEDFGSLSADIQPRQGVNLRLSFVGANPQPRLQPFNRLDTHVSYFLGNDLAKWHREVPVWGGVRYVDLYPGVDLELGAGSGLWGLRFAVHPGADLSSVRLRIEGAEEIAVDGDRLRLTTAIGPFSLPLILADDDTQLRPLLADGDIRFAIEPGSTPDGAGDAPFNPFALSVAKAASNSPSTLIYSRLIGGLNFECAFTSCNIAVDASGAAYITGQTLSDDFPITPGAFQTTYGDFGDAFVTKLNPSGSAYEYSTYLGGTSDDLGAGIALDGSGAAYVVGWTNSIDFPTTAGAYQTTCRSCTDFPDVFIAKLNPLGNALDYATYLGGTNDDTGNAIALDASGAAYVIGATGSTDFPITPGAVQSIYGEGDHDAFVAKLNPAGNTLAYSTYLGGSERECYPAGCDIALDASGAAYVTGHTQSADFPTTEGAFQATYNGGDCGLPPNIYPCPDGFVAKLTINGSASRLEYSTYLGGNSEDRSYSIAVDGSGAAYVTGYTFSAAFPTTPGAYDPTCICDPANFIGDGFIMKLNADGSAPIYSTFMGGSMDDYGYGITVGSDGAAYITGYTYSADYPTTPGAFQTTCASCPGYDAIVTRLNPGGSALLYSSFLGGTSEDYGSNIVVDTNGKAYITGQSWSLDFPIMPRGFQASDPSHGDICHCPDAFVTKLDIRRPLFLPLVLSN